MSQEVIEELKEKIDTDTLVGSDVQLTSVQEPYKFCDILIQNQLYHSQQARCKDVQLQVV